MGDLFAGPYVFLEPDFAFVLDDGRRAVGYVIGTPDTAAFARAYRARWIPRLAGRYPVPPDPPTSQDEEMLALHYQPERLVRPGLEAYPAHLHIDLLPEAQGRGYGRALIESALISALSQAGIPGVHLTMDPANTAARDFYTAVGFEDLPSSTPDAPVVEITGGAAEPRTVRVISLPDPPT
jgi:GNAT superfamily N-acetyltransferase